MTPRRFKCSQFRKGTLDFNVECIKLLQNEFRKERYVKLNATIPGQDRIYPKTHMCRTFFAENIKKISSHPRYFIGEIIRSHVSPNSSGDRGES